jgi:hypothetical protein
MDKGTGRSPDGLGMGGDLYGIAARGRGAVQVDLRGVLRHGDSRNGATMSGERSDRSWNFKKDANACCASVLSPHSWKGMQAV